MKKTIISMLLLSTLSQTYAIEKYNVIITKEHANYKNEVVVTPPEAPIYSSCKEILDNGNSIGDGVYEIKNNDRTYDVYCDMTSSGGGWTMVLAQFESDSVLDWDEGIQNDYDPSLLNKKGFTLNTEELPTHSQMAFSHTDFDGMKTNNVFFNYKYTTGNIDKTEIVMNTGKKFHIHRNKSFYYNYHDPDSTINSITHWNNTLTIDSVVIRGYDFAFSVNADTSEQKGYAYNGLRVNMSILGAWVIWVR